MQSEAVWLKKNNRRHILNKVNGIDRVRICKMRDLYIKMIDKYIESRDMRDYLKSIVDELSKW